MAREVTPVVIGGLEAVLGGRVWRACRRAATSPVRRLWSICLAWRRAQCAIGNDTGPMHVVAAAGAVTMLFSRAEALVKNRPLGPHAEVLFAPTWRPSMAPGMGQRHRGALDRRRLALTAGPCTTSAIERE